jgi:hypothetical protein
MSATSRLEEYLNSQDNSYMSVFEDQSEKENRELSLNYDLPFLNVSSVSANNVLEAQ